MKANNHMILFIEKNNNNSNKKSKTKSKLERLFMFAIIFNYHVFLQKMRRGAHIYDGAVFVVA